MSNLLLLPPPRRRRTYGNGDLVEVQLRPDSPWFPGRVVCVEWEDLRSLFPTVTYLKPGYRPCYWVLTRRGIEPKYGAGLRKARTLKAQAAAKKLRAPQSEHEFIKGVLPYCIL